MFKNALKFTLKHEGYYAFVVGDRGGETYRGISRVHHGKWEGWKLIDIHKSRFANGHVPHNTRFVDPRLDEMISVFYETHFWNKIFLNELNKCSSNFALLSMLVFDSYVHHGGLAIKFLQRAANELLEQAGDTTRLKDDGVLGRITLGVLVCLDPCQLHDLMKEKRRAHLIEFASRPGQSKFLNGFINRIQSFPTLS